MFERCGLNDIFYILWRKKWWITGITALCCGVGILLSFLLPSAPTPTQPSAPVAQKKWVASYYYLVEDAAADDTQNRSNDFANTALAMVKSHYPREEAYSALLKTHSKEDIINAFELNAQKETLSQFSLSKVLQSNLNDLAPIINLSAEGTNETIVVEYVTKCGEAMIDSVAAVENCSITVLSTVVSEKIITPDNQHLVDTTYQLSFQNSGLLFAILGCMLSILFFVFKSVFFPTINRRSDFCAYDVPVLSEIKLPKQGGIARE